MASQFFSKELTYSWEGGSRVIDDTLGAVFDLEIVDLNRDGQPELLATYHEGGGKGAVFTYEIPADPSQLSNRAAIPGFSFPGMAPTRPICLSPLGTRGIRNM